MISTGRAKPRVRVEAAAKSFSSRVRLPPVGWLHRRHQDFPRCGHRTPEIPLAPFSAGGDKTSSPPVGNSRLLPGDQGRGQGAPFSCALKQAMTGRRASWPAPGSRRGRAGGQVSAFAHGRWYCGAELPIGRARHAGRGARYDRLDPAAAYFMMGERSAWLANTCRLRGTTASAVNTARHSRNQTEARRSALLLLIWSVTSSTRTLGGERRGGFCSESRGAWVGPDPSASRRPTEVQGAAVLILPEGLGCPPWASHDTGRHCRRQARMRSRQTTSAERGALAHAGTWFPDSAPVY